MIGADFKKGTARSVGMAWKGRGRVLERTLLYPRNERNKIEIFIAFIQKGTSNTRMAQRSGYVRYICTGHSITAARQGQGTPCPCPCLSAAKLDKA